MLKYKDLIICLRRATYFEEIDGQRKMIAELIPEIKIMFEYNQNNHAHQYDLWRHCVETVINLPKDIDDDILFMAALLHDIGKPDCRCEGKRIEDTNMHYYGHPKRSMEIVRDCIVPKLESIEGGLTKEEIRRLLYYIEYHDDRVSLRIKHLKRHLKMVSIEDFQNLMHLQVADAKAHVMLPMIEERIRICGSLAGEYGSILYAEYCNLQNTIYSVT